MEGRPNPEYVMRVIVFFLACGVLVSCFTELMLGRLEEIRTRAGEPLRDLGGIGGTTMVYRSSQPRGRS